MKVLYTTTFMLSLMMCGVLQSAEDTLISYAKVGLRASLTAGFSYALWRLYQDIETDQKRYYQTTNYFHDNKNRLASDTFTAVGLVYLTYQSGLYTLEAMKNLIDTEHDEEKQQA